MLSPWLFDMTFSGYFTYLGIVWATETSGKYWGPTAASCCEVFFGWAGEVVGWSCAWLKCRRKQDHEMWGWTLNMIGCLQTLWFSTGVRCVFICICAIDKQADLEKKMCFWTPKHNGKYILCLQWSSRVISFFVRDT